MFSRLALPTFVLSSLLVVLADPMPTSPSPGQVFNAGSTCTIAWTADTTGAWKSLDIELMTGDNTQMMFLTTVAAGIDGTASPGTYSYPCPNVSPNSAIYFYQFSAAGSTNLSWTGRFAIASSSGATTPAPNATQPNGDPIPWGIGALTDPATAVPAPSYLTGTRNITVSTNTTTSMSSSATPSSTKLSSSTSSTESPSDTSSSSPAITSSTSSSNSAGGLVVGAVSMRAAQAGVALSVVAATFTFLF